MLGIVMYLYFLIWGYICVSFLAKEKSTFFRIWVGGVVGNLMLMMGIVVASLFLGFNIGSHVLLILFSLMPLFFFLKKKGKQGIKDIWHYQEDEGISKKIFLFLILPIVLLIGILLTNHILVPTESGGYASGQSTYGDLNMHLGFVTSIAEQGKFPPDYVFLSGHSLNYPFFINMLSSSLYLFGASLRWAVLIPSYVISLLLVMGFYFVGYQMTKSKRASCLATVFFFLCGGFGFAYFIEGAKEDIGNFTRIFTGYYETPTNFNDNNIRWSNTICDMIIPQRTTMAGWCMCLIGLWYLIEALKTKKTRNYVILGLLASCMPMIHTHSFLALGVICAVLFFVYLFGEKTKEERRLYIKNWFIFGGIVALIGFPQLFFWTFQQALGNESFVRFSWNWVNQKDPYVWFYLKNWGLVALFIIPAMISAKRDNRKLFWGSLGLFILAELFLFQPNEYDNNKLFYISYMIMLIIVCDWLIVVWDKLSGLKGRWFFAFLVVFLGTFSGILTIGREYYSGGQYETFSKDKIAIAEYIKENIPSDAIFLTSTSHLNPVCTLAGRNVYVGSSLYVFFHGFSEEYYQRENEVKTVYQASYEEIVAFCHEKNISYVYVGDDEMYSLGPNINEIEKLEKVYRVGNETIYKVQ